MCNYYTYTFWQLQISIAAYLFAFVCVCVCVCDAHPNKEEWCLGTHSLRTASGKTLVLTSDKCEGECADCPRTHAAADPLEL